MIWAVVAWVLEHQAELVAWITRARSLVYWGGFGETEDWV